MSLAAASPAFAEIHVDQNAKGEVMAVSGLAVDPVGCMLVTTTGRIVRREFAADAMTLVGITLEEARGKKSHYNVAPPPKELSAGVLANVTAGLQLFTRVGRKASISAYACGGAGRTLNLEAIK